MMKMATNALGILLLTFIPTVSFCDSVLPWSSESASAMTMHNVKDGESAGSPEVLIKAEINHSAGGEKNIYFTLQAQGKNNSSCSPSGEFVTRRVVYFDGQAIKMLSWCKKYSDIDTYYSEYTAATYPGANYIVDLFKTKHDNIVIKFPGIESEVSAKNFSDVWNKFGGDAL